MGAEAGRPRRVSCVYSRSRKKRLPILFDHSDHDHRSGADLCCKIYNLLKLGIVNHGMGAMRGKDREALLLVAIGIRGGLPLGPKDIFLTVHDYVCRSLRLKFDQLPNAKSNFAAFAANRFAPWAWLGYRPRTAGNFASL